MKRIPAAVRAVCSRSWRTAVLRSIVAVTLVAGPAGIVTAVLADCYNAPSHFGDSVGFGCHNDFPGFTYSSSSDCTVCCGADCYIGCSKNTSSENSCFNAANVFCGT